MKTSDTLANGGQSTNDEDGSTNEDDVSTTKNHYLSAKSKKANSISKELAGLLQFGKNGHSPRKTRTRGARISYNENQLYQSNVNQEKERVSKDTFRISKESKKSKDSRKSREDRTSSEVKVSKEARTSSKKNKKKKDKVREHEKDKDDPVMKESEKVLVAEVRAGQSNQITEKPEEIQRVISVQKEIIEQKESSKKDDGLMMPLDITEINLRVTDQRITDQTAPERKSHIASSFIQEEYSSATLGNLLCGGQEVIDKINSHQEDTEIAEEPSSNIVEVIKEPEKIETPKPVKKKGRKSKENKNVEEEKHNDIKEKSDENTEIKGKDDEPQKRKKKRERVVESQKIDDEMKEKKTRKKKKKFEIEPEVEQSGMADFEFVKNQILGTPCPNQIMTEPSASVLEDQSVTGLLDSFNNNTVTPIEQSIGINENPLTKRLKEVQKQRKSKSKVQEDDKISDSSQPPIKKKKSVNSSIKKSTPAASGTPISQQKSALSKQDHLKMHGLKTQLRQQKARISSDQKSELTPSTKVVQENKEFDHQCCICFERISERAKPQNCCHSFCMECILGWTKVHNLCPLCKIEITILEKYSSIEPNRCETIEIKKPEANEQEISDSLAFDNGPQFAESCEFCKSNEREEDQIVCEHCDFIIAHYACAGFEAIPECQWYCKRCTKELKARQQEDDKKRKQFKKAGKLPNPIRKRIKKTKKASPTAIVDQNPEEFDHQNLVSSNKNIYGDDDSQGSEKPGDGSQDYSDGSDSAMFHKHQKFVIRKSGRKTNQPRRYKSKSYTEDKEDSSSDSSQQQVINKKQRNRNSENVPSNRKRLLEESPEDFESSDHDQKDQKIKKVRQKKSKAKVDRKQEDEESNISDDSSNLEPKESKNFKPKVQQKKKKMTKKSFDSQKPIPYDQNDILEKRRLAVDNEIMQKSTGSILNQKLNLSMFGKFGNKLSLNPTSFKPMFPETQPFQNIPLIEPDLFDGFSARRRPDGILPGMNINPMLNKMHDQQMNLQRTPIPYNNLLSTHINLENKKDNQKHTQNEEANFLRQSQNKINKIVSDSNVSQKQIDQEHVTNPFNQKVCELQYPKQQSNLQNTNQIEPKPSALIPLTISQDKSTEPNRVSEGDLHLDITNDQIRTQKKVTFCSQNESIGCSSTGVSTNSNNNINPHGSNIPYFNYQVHSQDIPQSRYINGPSHLDRPKCYQSDLSSTESYKNDIYRQLDKHGQSQSKKQESHQNEIAHLQKKMDSKLQETRNRQPEATQFYGQSQQFQNNVQNKRDHKYSEKQNYQVGYSKELLANSFSLNISNSPLENLHIGSSNPPLSGQDNGSFQNNEMSKRPRLEIEEDIDAEQKQQKLNQMTRYQQYMMQQQSRMHDQNLMPHLKHQQHQLSQMANQVVSPVYHRPLVHTPSKPHQVNAPKGLVSMSRPQSNDSPQSKITEYVSPPQNDNFDQEMQAQDQVSSLGRGLVPMKTTEYKPKPYLHEATQPYDKPEYFRENPQEYAPQPPYYEAPQDYSQVPLRTPDVIPDQNLHIHDNYYQEDQIEETGEKRSSKRRSQTDSWSGGQVKQESQANTASVAAAPAHSIQAQSHVQIHGAQEQNQNKKQQNKEVREKINNFFDSCKFTKNDKASPVKHKIDGLSVAKSRNGELEYDKNGKPKDPNILYWFKTPQGKYMPVMKDKAKTRQNQVSVIQKNKTNM